MPDLDGTVSGRDDRALVVTNACGVTKPRSAYAAEWAMAASTFRPSLKKAAVLK